MTSQFYYFLTDNQYQLTTAVYWPIYRCMYQHKRKNYFGDSRHRSQVLKILINFATLFDPDTIKLKKKRQERKEKSGLQAYLSKGVSQGTYICGLEFGRPHKKRNLSFIAKIEREHTFTVTSFEARRTKTFIWLAILFTRPSILTRTWNTLANNWRDNMKIKIS